MSATDADLDDMHHALGRPDGPVVKPFRNHYVLDAACDQADRMRASPHWIEGRRMNRGADAVFAVTDQGKAAVWAWLAAKQRAAGLRRYVVSADHVQGYTVMAKSRADAKHDLYIHLVDAGWCQDGFRDFLRLRPSARLA